LAIASFDREMFLFGSNFALEEKRRNFDYYDP
jgi:hypothetical protein